LWRSVYKGEKEGQSDELSNYFKVRFVFMPNPYYQTQEFDVAI